MASDEPVEQWEATPGGSLAGGGRLPPREESRRKAREAVASYRTKTEQIALRVPVEDLEAVKNIAKKKGLPYQTMLKGLIHEYVEQNKA